MTSARILYWRRAATLNPTNEQVWLALLNVLEKEGDIVVCLQNIIAINPNNKQALRRLRNFEDSTQPTPATQQFIQPRNRRRIVIWLLEAALAGVLLAVVVWALLYRVNFQF